VSTIGNKLEYASFVGAKSSDCTISEQLSGWDQVQSLGIEYSVEMKKVHCQYAFFSLVNPQDRAGLEALSAVCILIKPFFATLGRQRLLHFTC
jgi:hypothetical protein